MAEVGIRAPRKALTARFVETIVTPGKYFDGHGLFLRVRANGGKQWVQRITIRGKRSELGLGSPPAVPLATARKLALEHRGKAMTGGDPLADRRKEAAVLSFEEAVDRYLANKLDEFGNEKHRKQWRSTLDTYANPILGPKRVSEITMQDVLRVLEPIWRTKTETAKRLRGRIENVLSWAAVAGYRTGDNPARWKGNLAEILPKPSKVAKSENFPALALGDAVDWWRKLALREGMAARALQFMNLTAARSKEVRGMKWDQLDLGNDTTNLATTATTATWTRPAELMKNKREHRVPLTPHAIAILNVLPRMEDSPYVFFAPRGGMLSDMSISAVMRRMHQSELKIGNVGFLDPRSKRPAVPHGLRSTFRQWTAERGYQRDMAEIALAHFIGSDVERAYQRSDMLERRRAMMAAWAGFIEGQANHDDTLLKLVKTK